MVVAVGDEMTVCHGHLNAVSSRSPEACVSQEQTVGSLSLVR